MELLRHNYGIVCNYVVRPDQSPEVKARSWLRPRRKTQAKTVVSGSQGQASVKDLQPRAEM
jgi:hypothetical protein